LIPLPLDGGQAMFRFFTFFATNFLLAFIGPQELNQTFGANCAVSKGIQIFSNHLRLVP
jgi:hypothetical protein